ncbi:hypothetical protein [Leptospira sanjuanensis]|uniref:hypothetical protein n=1 Tax=Leptospira sanjuanensis TaxID=2879643 RepID=UPI001EE8547D|nr:hypothetical protein [Leptospira sanjuanensis]MCG6167196.1 hypothetical protein [Leptospira sanjuanensis]MCG6167208.1 hypothetical protein [Leptospira sanjuanensis]
MKPTKEKTHKGNSQKRQDAQEEVAIQKRMDAYRKRLEKMSPLKRNEELKLLLRNFREYRKKIQGLISQMRKFVEKEIEVERKLKIIGEKMRGS